MARKQILKTQRALEGKTANDDSRGVLTCAFGEPQMEAQPIAGYHCVKCCKFGLQLQRQFQEAVNRGAYCKHGYSPKEAKASGHICTVTGYTPGRVDCS